MIKAVKSLLYAVFFLFFFMVFSAGARAESLPAPTLIAPNEKTTTGSVKPLVTGLTKSGSRVKIFIDGVYNGKTEILNHESGTANFAYKPFLNLSRGRHEIYAVAEDVSGQAGLASEVLRFNIELPLPAPTIFKPVVNRDTSNNRPFIVGLAKNDSRIKIYIDKKYNGEFEVKNHKSGTANFSYKPAKPLARGAHLVYAVAFDKRGKESIWSNIIYFKVKSSAIAQSAAEERKDAIAEIKEPESAPIFKAEPPVISKSSGAVEEKTEMVPEKLKDLTGVYAGEKATTTGGVIDESRRSQGKLKLSLVLFILFLIGVIAWLIWVNRELVKERQAQNQAGDSQPSDEQKNKLL